MFNLEKAIAAWRNQMLAAGIKSPVPLDELESHLREQLFQLQLEDLTDVERFQIAVGRIGPAQKLKQEFAKARSLRALDYFSPSTSVNVLGGWYVLMGFSMFHFFSRIRMYGFAGDTGSTFAWAALCSFQILLGIGLWRRSNFCRWAAVAWAVIYVMMCVVGLPRFGDESYYLICRGLHVSIGQVASIPQTGYWQTIYMATRFGDLQTVIAFLTPGIFLWGGWLLTRRYARQVFRHETQAEIA